MQKKPTEVFYKNVFLKISQNSQENTCESLFNEITTLENQRAIQPLNTKYQIKVIQKIFDAIDMGKPFPQINHCHFLKL